MAGARYCDALSTPAFIPDNSPTGISNTIAIADNTIISDLNVWLDLTHTWVGDLIVDLTHVETGTSVRLMDRVGAPALASGCNRDDVEVALDDQGPRPVQDECLAATPTLAGRPRPASPLSVFNGQSVAGTWRLTVSDNASSDTGSLLGWCLEVNAPLSPPPLVTSFSCNGNSECVLTLNEPFDLSFSFTDPDTNASAWRIIGQRDDGVNFGLAQALIVPLSGSDTIPLSFAGFTCSQGNCPTTAYDFSLVVSDATRVESAAAQVHVVVLGSVFNSAREEPRGGPAAHAALRRLGGATCDAAGAAVAHA
jgi:subtilisin-like proprotein convertase family protein